MMTGHSHRFCDSYPMVQQSEIHGSDLVLMILMILILDIDVLCT